MLPDTYTPTTQEEIEAFASESTRKDLLELKQQWILASNSIANLERTYLYQGMQYHTITTTHAETIPNVARDVCKASFTISKLPDGSLDALPVMITHIQQLRSLREKMCQSIESGNLEDGQEDLESINTFLAEAESELAGLEREQQAGFVDIGGSSTLRRVLEETDELVHGALSRDLPREWILNLPEVKASLELGILENEDQAVESTLESVVANFDAGGDGEGYYDNGALVID